MDSTTIERLNTINREFYATTATEFDATRQQKWRGWDLLIPHIRTPRTVLDVGCGNGRFGAFLATNFKYSIDYHGIDNNPALLAYARKSLSAYTNLNVILTQSDIMSELLPSNSYDLVVLFGVLHHIPGAENRLRFMRALSACVAEGGLLVFASWCFYDHARFRERIIAWDDDLKDHVEKHDYLLDWRRGERAVRYCHYVDASEHNALIQATGLREVRTYSADGETGDLNRYSMLQKHK